MSSGAGITSLLAVAVTCGCVVLLLLFTACGIGGDSIRLEIVDKAKSPDGTMTAVVVGGYQKDPSSNNYGVVVGVEPSNMHVEKAAKNGDLSRYVVMTAYTYTSLRLGWRDNTTLIVSCVSCQLGSRDFTIHTDHLGLVNIVYKGFPEQPAPPTTP